MNVFFDARACRRYASDPQTPSDRASTGTELPAHALGIRGRGAGGAGGAGGETNELQGDDLISLLEALANSEQSQSAQSHAKSQLPAASAAQERMEEGDSAPRSQVPYRATRTLD